MPNILDSIQVSGSSYDIKDKNAPSVSAVTQQEYDNLPSSAKTSNTFFVITDAQAGDLTQYWTSAQTQSAITEATSGKADTSAVTAVQDSLSGYVTTDTNQDITGVKTFVGDKRIKFRRNSASDKLGFTCYDTEVNGVSAELGMFELRGGTITEDGVSHRLMSMGHYWDLSKAYSADTSTYVGFRNYYGATTTSQRAGYNLVAPLAEFAKPSFSLTGTFKNFYMPLGFKNGSTTILTDRTGVADFSDVLGGLKLVKLTQSEYDNLGTKDDNTLYFIGDSTNGYTMKIGNASVN